MSLEGPLCLSPPDFSADTVVTWEWRYLVQKDRAFVAELEIISFLMMYNEEIKEDVIEFGYGKLM